MEKYKDMMQWLAGVYVNSLNIIHYMHDKYCYERIQMALHDKHVHRWFATGIAGLSVVADSLSAIKYAKVHPVRDEQGIIVDFEIEGDFPKYGNDDDRVDVLAHDIVHQFMEYIRMNDTYRNSVPTTSVLTITSNVVYGKKNGATPDGRKAALPFAPGANPMHQRDTHGAIASSFPPSPSFRSATLRTASPTPSPSSPARWARRTRCSLAIWTSLVTSRSRTLFPAATAPTPRLPRALATASKSLWLAGGRPLAFCPPAMQSVLRLAHFRSVWTLRTIAKMSLSWWQ